MTDAARRADLAERQLSAAQVDRDMWIERCTRADILSDEVRELHHLHALHKDEECGAVSILQSRFTKLLGGTFIRLSRAGVSDNTAKTSRNFMRNRVPHVQNLKNGTKLRLIPARDNS